MARSSALLRGMNITLKPTYQVEHIQHITLTPTHGTKCDTTCDTKRVSTSLC